MKKVLRRKKKQITEQREATNVQLLFVYNSQQCLVSNNEKTEKTSETIRKFAISTQIHKYATILTKVFQSRNLLHRHRKLFRNQKDETVPAMLIVIN